MRKGHELVYMDNMHSSAYFLVYINSFAHYLA